MNKMYKVIWNKTLNTWVAVSELTKGNKKTKASCASDKGFGLSAQTARSKTSSLLKLNTVVLSLASALGATQAYALSANECTTLGSSCTVVNSFSELKSALEKSGTASTIVLGQNITLTGDINVDMLTSNRKNLVIDGGGNNLETGLFTFVLTDQTKADWNENGTLSFKNFNALTSHTGSQNPVVETSPTKTTVDIVFDNIGSFSNSMYAVMGNVGAGGAANTKSQLVFGNIEDTIRLTYGTDHQLAQVSNIKFTGKFNLVAPGTPGTYNTVFWSNAGVADNKMTFTSTSDVTITATNLVLTNDGTHAFMYFLEDGAKLNLQTPQNVFGSQNNGLVIGSYTPEAGFGNGVTLKLANLNGGLLDGDGVSNVGGGKTGGLGNGVAQTGNVIFNLGQGSELNTSGATNSAIRATKNAGVNSNVYVSSGALINASGSTGITASHSGSGDVIVQNTEDGIINANTGIVFAHNGLEGRASLANHGTINSTKAGIQVNSTQSRVVNIDGVNGVINAESGDGIDIQGNALVTVNGGTINAKQGANGIKIATNNSGSHNFNDVTVNVEGSGSGVVKGDATQLNLAATKIAVANGIGINNLVNIAFLESANGRNEISVTGTGTGVQTSSASLVGWKPSALDIKVTGDGKGIQVNDGGADFSDASFNVAVSNANGTGIAIVDGANNTTTLGQGVLINAEGATALLFNGTAAKTLNNTGVINGNVVFNNAAANVIEHAGLLNGRLTTGSGNDSLTVSAGARGDTLIDLGDGNNIVTIQDGAQFSSITTGAGDDVFTLSGFSADSADTVVGRLNAGAGNNVLNVIDSANVLDALARLENFATVNLESGDLTLSNSNNVQNDSAITLNESSNLVLNDSFTGSLSNAISGSGVVTINGNDVLLAGANESFSGVWDINGGATISNASQLGAGSVSLNGLLNASYTGSSNFDNALTGNGVLAVTMTGPQDMFSFTANTGSGFTGTLQLNQAALMLDDTNQSALSGASLGLGVGAKASIDTNRSVNTLTFAGGTLSTSLLSPTNAYVLTVDHLDLDPLARRRAVSQVGTINLDTGIELTASDATGQFLDQDNVLTGSSIQVVKANTVSSSGTQLAVTLNGEAPVDTTYSAQSDGFGNDDLGLTYGYMAVSNSDPSLADGVGLYVGYVLKTIETNSNFVLSTAGAKDTSLGAQLTGAGGVEYQAGSKVITLLNSANDYTGESWVSSGGLVLGADHVLGDTSALRVSSEAFVDVNGMAQTVGELAGDVNSLLNLNGGELTITNGGSSLGTLTGTGVLAVSGDLLVSGANDDLNAEVSVTNTARVSLDNASGLGSSRIDNQGAVVLSGLNGRFANEVAGQGSIDVINGSDVHVDGQNFAFNGALNIDEASRVRVTQLSALGLAKVDSSGELVIDESGDATLTNELVGSGRLTKLGAGTLRINSAYAHTGGTNVAQGILVLGTPSAELSGGGLVSVAAGATLGGYGKITGDVQNDGLLAIADATPGVAAGAGTLVIDGDLINHNTVQLAGKTVGNVLHVLGNYSAASDLVLNTVLGDDLSLTDQLIVDGNTAGHTNVTVSNIGGQGDQTTDGIKVITVGGESVGTFALTNRLAYGAYDYGLVQVGKDWLLQSKKEEGVRAEAGAYLANQTAVKELFNSSLQTRMGSSSFTVLGSDSDRNARSWARVGGTVTRSSAADQIDQKIWSNHIQIGTDLVQSLGQENRFYAGVMAGAGSAKTRNKNDRKAEVARSEVDGYSVGAYGTWFANGASSSEGAYVDTWLQYGWYDNQVQGEKLAKESSYDSSLLTASIEAGWGHKVYERRGVELIVQPQAQLTYQDYRANDRVETTGTNIHGYGSDGFSSRVGGRLLGKFEAKSGQKWEASLDANWVHDSAVEAVAMNEKIFHSDIPKNRFDIKVGLQTQSKNWNFWTSVGTQQGSNGYSRVEGMLGMKYHW